MQAGKWISDLTSDTPVADAARRVLALRLEVVRDYLGLALRSADEGPEYVHQLRVGTRRAGAALDIFAVCLTERAYKSARRELRRLRRAAGEARDWDVFLSGLAEDRLRLFARRRQAGLDFLVGYGLSRRVAAQAMLEEASADYPFGFEKMLAEVLAGIHRPPPPVRTLLDLARPELARLHRELDEATSRNLDDYDNLHQVRIVGKRLRYAMEVFADCFAPAFRERMYPAVEEMQEILGRANDSHVACQRLSFLCEKLRAVQPKEWRRFRSGIEELMKRHERRLPEERQRFLEWWTAWQRDGGDAMFTALLKTSPPTVD